jgi:hypothetical protein
MDVPAAAPSTRSVERRHDLRVAILRHARDRRLVDAPVVALLEHVEDKLGW